MACDLTSGRLNACFDTVAGIKAVYFADNGTLGALTYDLTDTDVITTFGGTPEFFKYLLKGSSNSYVETITKDRNNGTSYISQALSITLPKLTKSMHKELMLLVHGSPHVVIEDYNGNLLVMGLENGADVNGGTIVSGAARGDLSGYTLTMMAEEKKPANFLDTSDITDTTATVSAVNEAP